MPRILILLLSFMLTAPALAPAAAMPAPATDSLSPANTDANAQVDATSAGRREREGQKGKQDKQDKQDKRERRHKRDKKRPSKKPPVPTCFGQKATIILKGDESQVGTPANDVIIGDNKRNAFALISGGTDRVCLGGGTDLVNVFGTTPSRLLADGGPGADTIIGGNFDFGSAPGDVLIGGDGNDLLGGALGADDLFGGEGNDRLFGGGGTDILDGGPGADTCQHSDDGEEFNC